MAVPHSHAQFDNMRAKATRPITLVRWQHSGGLETLSLSGRVEFNGEIYLPGTFDSIKFDNNDSAIIVMPASDQRYAESSNKTWRGSKICEIWEVSASADDDEEVFTLDQGILVIDGIIDDSRVAGGKVTVEVLHKYLVKRYTPRLKVNDFTTTIPVAGSFIKVGTDRYQLKSRRLTKKESNKKRALRGRLSVPEINSFTPDDRALDVEVTADGAMLPVVYGRNPLPGLICAHGVDGSGNFIYVVAWCIGPIFQIQPDDIFNNDAPLPSTAIVHTYRGLKCQGVDNYAASIVGLTYTDNWKLLTPNGTACASISVIRLPSSTTEAPHFQCIARGRLVYDPRQGGTDYFDNMGQNKVGHNLQFIGANGTTPTTGMDVSHVGAAISWFGHANIQGNKLSLDGTGDYIRKVRGADDRFGTDVWSWELVCTPSTHNVLRTIAGIGNSTSDCCIIIFQYAQAVYVSMSSNGTSMNLLNFFNIDNAALFSGVKTNILIEFDKRGYFFYIDGEQKHYLASTASLHASTADLYLGSSSVTASGGEFAGTFTGSRFDKGVIRYGGVHVTTATPYADSEDNVAFYGYTGTAAACVADFVKNPHYGFGATETIPDLLKLFKFNESTIGGAPRATIGMVISEPRLTPDWMDQLCGTYAEANWFVEGPGIAITPDKITGKYNPSGWELSTNGDFVDDAADWTLGSGWSHLGYLGVDGLLAAPASSAVTQTLGKPTVAGDIYVITVSLDERVAGSLRVDLDGVTVIEPQTVSGVYAYEFVATGSETTISMVGASLIASVDEFSCRRKFWRDDSVRRGSITITPLKSSDAPNRLIATYRKPSNSSPNWGDELPIIVQMPGVGVDGMAVIDSRVRFEGLRGYSKTLAKAKTTLYRIQDKEAVAWVTTDQALVYRRGMVIEAHDREYSRTIYAVLESRERLEPGWWLCRGSRYSEMHYPADQVLQTGPVPVNLIFPLSGSTVPSGYQLCNSANGKYVKCAGEIIAIGSTGGASTYAGISGDTSADGAHGDQGEEGFPAAAFTGTSGAGSGRLYSAIDDEAGTHDHPYDTGVITPDLYRREMIFVKKITSPGTDLPPEVMAFGLNNLLYPDTFRYTAFAKRLVLAAEAAANGGVLQQLLPVTVDDADDEHEHGVYTSITNGSPGGTAVTDPHNEPVAGGGVHGHNVTLVLNRNVRKYAICLYASGQNFGMGPGMMAFYEDDLDDLHQDFTLVDGRLSTPYIEGRILEIANYGEEGQARGNNTLKISGTTAWSAKHDHKGDEDDDDVAAVVELSHGKLVRHRHSIVNPAEPTGYTNHHSWEPPFHAWALVMYNPNPVPTQRDVYLLLDGDMPDGDTTIIDISAYGHVGSVLGTGTLAYSDDQQQFGLNSLYGTGKRIKFTSFNRGKKWTERGRFRNNATGLMFLFGNYVTGHDSQTYSVQKSATGNIELYVGTTLRATVALGLTSNEWFYCALCYDYAEFRLYAGKVSSGIATRATYASAAFNAWPLLGVFDIPDSFFIPFPFTGYITQFQVITGAAIHSGANVPIPDEAFQDWHSLHAYPGHFDWQNPGGIVDGHYTNLEPDLDQAALPWNPGGRCSIWREVGQVDYTVSVVWPGIHDTDPDFVGEAGIAVCLSPDEDELSLGFNFESAFGCWVLWHIGRSPEQIQAIDLDLGPPPLYTVLHPHVSGTPVTISVQISGGGTTYTCKADGVTIFTGTVPTNLQGSTKVSVYHDTNRAPVRSPGMPALVAPFTIVRP